MQDHQYPEEQRMAEIERKLRRDGHVVYTGDTVWGCSRLNNCQPVQGSEEAAENRVSGLVEK